MKLLIAYATKTGTTEECAEMLASHFSGHEVVLANLEKETPEVSDFDAVVIGSNVRAGKIHKAVKAFAQANADSLANKRFGLYLCCNFSDAADTYFEKNFSEDVLSRACAALCFGGEIKMERQKGLDKLIMKIVMGIVKSHNRDEDRDEDIPLPAKIPENIRRMADAIKQGADA